MENLTLDDPMEGGGVAARPGMAAASGAGGPSGSGSSPGATSATPARQRKPGRWKRIPRMAVAIPSEHALKFPNALPPPGTKKFAPFLPGFRLFQPAQMPRESRQTESSSEKRQQRPLDSLEVVYARRGSREEAEVEERCNRKMLEHAKRLEEEDDDDDMFDSEEARAAYKAYKVKFSRFYRRLATTRREDVVFNFKPPSDTQEEHLTADDMEMKADLSKWPVCPQATHFATLALEHYNSNKKTHKFEMTKVLLSKCFSEVDGTTFAHVNFTAATPQQSTSHLAKRLFFAELMLIPDLQAYESTEPMRVLHVCTIDDFCFGGCHEMERDIKGPVRKDLDFDRCHACSERIKHPKGAQFIAGHNRTRMPYVSVFPLT